MKTIVNSILIFTFICAICLFTIGCHKKIFNRPPAWDKCTLSSNWTGKNASTRIMNILSPNMTDQAFQDRFNWAKGRGVNCFHVILANKSDGEKAGYSIYGPSFNYGNVDQNSVNVMLNRIKKIRKEGFGVILWLVTDDSTAWCKKVSANPQQYVNDLDRLGFFKEASTVVIGLEVDEYWSAGDCSKIYAAVKSKYDGKVGVHQVSDKYDKAGTCDIMFAQVKPGTSTSTIKNFVKTIKSKTGKPVCMFEMERQEDRARSQAALDAGAYAVGNW